MRDGVLGGMLLTLCIEGFVWVFWDAGRTMKAAIRRDIEAGAWPFDRPKGEPPEEGKG